MNLLSLYSKIQLKIEKVKKELKFPLSLERGLSREKPPSRRRGKPLSRQGRILRSKLQLLFWQTLKLFVRFLALLFNDSSNNFLIFTRLGKDSVFVCNNSYCQYKVFQKRVRFYTKTAFVGILICTIIATSVLYLFLPGKPSSHAKTFNWVQSGWGGAVNTSTFPNHTSNKTGWTDYYAKDSEVVVVDNADDDLRDLKLGYVTGSWTETSDTDFDAGTVSQTWVSGTGDSASIKLGLNQANFDCSGGTDHSGADWIPSNGEEIYGKHCNIGTFTVANGTTVYIKAYDGVNYGKVEIEAEIINIIGTLNGDGGGYLGGAGGVNNGQSGNSGTNIGSYGNIGGVGGAGSPGEFSGNGGAGGTSIGTVYGSEISQAIDMGGGAGGGGAGGYGDDGANGNAGGGAILLHGSNVTTVSGTITVCGGAGGDGGDGNVSPIKGGGGGGAGGAGGGVLASGSSVVISGTISANGGAGGILGDYGFAGGSDGNLGGGGRIKIFYNTKDTTSSTITATGYNNGTIHEEQLPYYSSGTFTSQIHSIENSNFWDTMTWADSGGQTITMKARTSNNADMSGATAWTSCNAIAKGTDISANNCVTDTHQYIQYQATLSTADTTQTPSLESVTINYTLTAYPTGGPYTLTSSPYDTDSAENVLSGIQWTEDLPAEFSWQRRKPITISPVTPEANYQVKVLLTSANFDYAKAEANGEDLRFYQTDETTQLDYWIETWNDSGNSTIWVKVANSGSSGIYMYYGNSGAGVESNAATTFTTPTTIATGGTITYDTNAYAIHTFTSSGTFTPNKTFNVEVLVVAGGGGGGNARGAGGGAGGLIHNMSYSVSTGNIDVTIGEGGAGGASYTARGSKGSNSVFGTLTAIGGGEGGAGGAGVQPGLDGGSGGGGAAASFAGGTATSGQGNDGGAGGLICTAPLYPAGGGGGAGVVGDAGDCSLAGDGGIGLSINISGTATYYAGGGGGSYYHNGSYKGIGGQGGGGDGGNSNQAGVAGTANTGGGGGGGHVSYVPTGYNGGNGGSGIVIIRYINRLITSPEPIATPDSGETTGNFLASSGADIKFQVRTGSSSADILSKDWCGPNDEISNSCDTTTYFTDPTGVTEAIDADFAVGDDDQWIQYKVYLFSTGSVTPTLFDMKMIYVINSAPTIAGVTAADSAIDGTIDIGYTISDVEEGDVTEEGGVGEVTISFLANTGATLNEDLVIGDATAITVSDIDQLPSASAEAPRTIQIDKEQIIYTGKSGDNLTGITRGSIAGNNTKAAGHDPGAVIWIKGTTATVDGDVGVITGVNNTPAEKTGTWNIKTDLDGIYYATAIIRVTANDGNSANQVGHGSINDTPNEATVYVLDVKDPAYSDPPLIIDSNAAGDSLTNIIVTENSTLSVRYANASNINGLTCATDIDSVAYEPLVGNSKEWSLNPDENGVSTVCFQAKDNYNNETAVTFASTPQTPINMQVSDISAAPAGKYRTLVWWDVVPDPGSFTQYNIHRSINGTDYIPYGSTTTSDHLINYCFDEGDGNCADDNLGGLDSATTYYYKITAQDADGISYYSSVVSAIPDGSTSGETDTAAPTLSSGPTNNTTSSTATISWATNEGSYSLVRYGTTTSLGSVAGSSTETVTSHSVDISGLTPGVLYYYQILSADSSGNLLKSPDVEDASFTTDNLYTFTTTADNTAPSLVGSPTVTAGRDSATISWTTDEASDSQVKYIVAVDETTDPAGGTVTTLQTEKVTNHFVIITGLSSDTTYNYQVISTDDYTNSLTSPSSAPFVQFATSTDKEDSTAPGITFNSTDDVTEGLTSATIVWTTDENAYSVVEYGLTEGLGSVAGTVDNSTMSHSVTISNLSNNTKYYYKIRSADSSGNLKTEPLSGTHTFTTTADAIDPVISSVTVASSDRSSAVITWSTDENASSQIEYGTNADLSGSSLTTLQTEKVLNHITVLTNLTPDISYYYRVISIDAANNSAQSSIGSFETISGDKPVVTFNEGAQGPSEANSSLGDRSASAEFSASSNAFFSIVYEASETEPGSYTQEYGVPSLVTADQSSAISLAGLEENTIYYYKLRARDIYGNIGESSSVYSFMTTTDIIPPDITFSSNDDVTFTDSTAVIVWTTDEAATSKVDYGEDTSYGSYEENTNYNFDHSITLNNLTPETTYHFKLTSIDNSVSGNSTVTEDYSFTTLAFFDITPPEISSVVISDIANHTAKITWTTNENSNSLIDYSKTSGIFTSTTGQYQDETISHTVTLRGLDPSTAYYLRARSIDASSNEVTDSSDGNGYTFTTTAGGDETPPEITNIIAGDPTYNSVTITWDTNELSNSLIDFGTSTSYGTTQGNSADSVTSHSVSLTGLIPETLYYYRVKSIDTSGNLVSDDNASGGYYSFTTAAGTSGDTTPPAITFNSETRITNRTSNSVTISWTTDEAADSTVGYSLDTSFNSEKGSAEAVTDHTVILTNLSSGAIYKFQIKSMDASGNLAIKNNEGDGYTFETLAGGDSTAPIISGVASGTCADTYCVVSWNTNENSSSLVDYGTVLGTYTSTGGNYKDEVTTHSVTLTSLTPETIYYYRVRSVDSNDNQALDAGGASGYSFTTIAASESECPACPSCGGGGSSCPSVDTNPPTISGIEVSEIGTGSVIIKWETGEDSDSFVEFGISSDYDKIDGSRTTTKNHSITLNNLESNTTYHYKVTSADSSGNLAQSPDQTFTTLNIEYLPLVEQEEEIAAQQETTAEEIQTKIEELLIQGMDEEEIRTIIARASQPPVIATEGPIVETLTNNSAKIIWVTDRKSNSVVRFKAKEEGVDPETFSSLKQYGNFKELAVDHQIILASLHSGTSYQYQVQSSDVLGNTSKSDWNEFTTEIIPSIYDVLISEVTLNSAVISWKTNVVSSSKVEYGETISYTDHMEDKDNSKVAKHLIKLNNLKSGTLYHFRVRGIDTESNNLVSDDYSFTTYTLPQIETYQIEEISERVIKLNWKTNVETDSAIKYTNLETNITKIQGEDGMSSIHNFNLKGLDPGIEYLLQIQGRDIYGNQAITSEFTATTLKDDTPPKITQVRTETAVSSGKSNTVQTIISWKTNEPSTSQILWEEGISKDKRPGNSTKEDENYTTNHIIVITSFKPSSVYRFRITGKDKAGNFAESQDFTILIPEKKKSVIQIIISNFEETFGWVKKLGG